jgi:hypothetical protein
VVRLPWSLWWVGHDPGHGLNPARRNSLFLEGYFSMQPGMDAANWQTGPFEKKY